MIKNKINNRGFAAMMALLIIIGLVSVITFSMVAVVSTEKKIDDSLVVSAQSYYSAESGIEDAVLRVIKNYNYNATNSFVLDGASVSQNITQVDRDIIIQSSATYLNNERKLETLLSINSDDISFHYGVQVGEGGLEMKNGSVIIGNLYSNGVVTGAIGPKILGDVFVAAGISIDNNGLWETYDDDRIFGKTDPEIDLAISFSPSVSENLSQVAFYIKKVGGPSDGTIRIMEDNAGSPSKTELASATLVVSKIGLTYGWVNFSFSSPANLIAGNPYWIIIDVDEKSSKYFLIGRALGNVNSVSKYSSDWDETTPVWTEDFGGDYEHRVWLGGVATSLNDVIVTGDAHANTINNSNICGDAYYQTIDAASLAFLNSPSDPPCSGLLTVGTAHPGSPDSPIEALPVSDSNINDWEADALAGGTYSDAAHCQPAVDIVLGPAKLDCDFAPAVGTKITLSGTVWVSGDIDLSNNNIVELASGYGADSGIIIADKIGSEATNGIITVKNNTEICGSNGYDTVLNTCNASNDTYVLLISTHSSDVTDAITISNNIDGAIFYAHNGSVIISNNANLKEVTAYKLKLENNTAVTYESGLANACFSSGPGGGWSIGAWNETQ